ncbi:MAG: polyprenol monophosphomannose synthase [Candidatus Omnitrophica bacterium]|nr:polyprenol monophosphomannose synthase [Candidatus Omnitrophota bacterium]
MQKDNVKKFLVVVPTYNESRDIAKMVNAIKSLNLGISILIIDDNSPDGTGLIVDELCKKNDDVYVLHREKKLGLGSAYVKGFKFALENNYDYICEMDADFSHDPKYLVDFYRGMEDCDLVIASRYIDGISIVNWGLCRLLMSYFANKFVRLITGMPFTDCMGGFKCFRASVLKGIGLDNIIAKGYVIQMEMLYRTFKKGYKIKEIPIIFYNRKHGRSKMNRVDILESFFVVIYLKFLSGFKIIFNRERTIKQR